MAIINFNSISGVSTITASTSITVGDKFISNTGVGLGATTTTGRNAGVGTATGTLIYNSTIGRLEIYSGLAGWIGGLSVPFSATGGTESTTIRAGYKVHTFTSPGTLTVSQGSVNVEYLVVGGGGSSSGFGGGGGGAGGMLTGTINGLITPLTIQVGAGGAAGPGSPPWAGSNGTPSFITSPGISSITSLGGGYSGNDSGVGNPGGSGGGAGSRGDGAATGGNGTPGQGNNGGNQNTPGVTVDFSAGGGGAGAVGENGQPNRSGNGGIGLQSSINGTTTYYAGGGGGGSRPSSLSPGAGGTGGSGGGGNGVPKDGPNSNGTAGTTNTGGGGGGSRGYAAGVTAPGFAGGSGIVIIAYPS